MQIEAAWDAYDRAKTATEEEIWRQTRVARERNFMVRRDLC